QVQVAIKCLPKDQVKGQTSDFLQEATIMHSICHPHIIKLHGIVTELAPLKSLLECLKDASMQTTFTLQHLYNLVTQLADAMMYLEKNRLVHRDLAARNVLM
ncbi:hypothetical protein HELRODRAFT_145654, partial [Helobdella robusta]|uniref:Protein kinase domain-containing protein n=1 Tax=Helobdella robusta TaxID=6412 RepID=T1EJL7_HELRO